jgi:hypothetical protein
MTNEELVELIAKYVAKNTTRESIFTTPHPRWELDAYALLDYISSISGVSQEQIGKWCCEGAC